MNWFRRNLALGSLVALCWACEGSSTPATPVQQQQQQVQAPPEEPLAPAPSDPGISDDASYAYSPIGKRDPFRSLFEQFEQDAYAKDLTELQKFEIDQLRLVGIVSRIATPYALVEDPNGKGHTLTRGKLIGKNWGRVASISPDCVIVREEYRDYTGRKVTNTTDLCIPKPTDIAIE